MEQAILVVVNAPDLAQAQTLARQLIENRLAACVSVLPGVQSIYRWRGDIEEANEVTLFIKTTAAHYVELESMVVAHHPYQVPEVIALPISHGLPAYLNWIHEETAKDVGI